LPIVVVNALSFATVPGPLPTTQTPDDGDGSLEEMLAIYPPAVAQFIRALDAVYACGAVTFHFNLRVTLQPDVHVLVTRISTESFAVVPTRAPDV
jgi:hypothetical protein